MLFSGMIRRQLKSIPNQQLFIDQRLKSMNISYKKSKRPCGLLSKLKYRHVTGCTTRTRFEFVPDALKLQFICNEMV